MQGSYQDFLANSYKAQTKKSTPVNVASTSSLLKPIKHRSSASIAGSSQPKKVATQQHSSKSAQLPYDFGKNIASSFSGIPLSSPTLSKSPFAHQTPPLAHSPSSNISPQKTLQQKLAERKQQNSQQKKKPDDDVIVLD